MFHRFTTLWCKKSFRRSIAHADTVSFVGSSLRKASDWERALLLVAELTAVQLPGNAIAYNAAAWVPMWGV